MKNNNNNNKINHKDKTNKKVRKEPGMSANLVVPSPFPQKRRYSLCCNTGPIVVQDPLNTYAKVPFVVNDPWGGAPILARPNSGFYNSLASIYNLSKVVEFKIRYTVVANEPSIACQFGIFFSDVDPAVLITSRQSAIDALEKTPSSGPQMIGSTVGASVYRSPWYTIRPGAVIGSRYEGDIDYGAQTGTQPAQRFYGAFNLVSGGGGALINGVILDLEMVWDTEFSSPVT